MSTLLTRTLSFLAALCLGCGLVLGLAGGQDYPGGGKKEKGGKWAKGKGDPEGKPAKGKRSRANA